jgi:hypothetical protein
MNIQLEPGLERMRSIGASAHVVAHLGSMALLHRDGRYDRSSGDVNLLTGVSPMSIEDFVRAHQNDFLKADARSRNLSLVGRMNCIVSEVPGGRHCAQ